MRFFPTVLRSSRLLRLGGLPAALCALHASASTLAQTGGTEAILYAAGDIADCRKTPAAASPAARTAQLIARHLAEEPSAWVLTLGDNTYPVGRPEEFTRCYAPTWGAFKERTLPAPGNHDYAMPQALGYFDYFGAQAGPDRRGYYARRIGHWLLLSLNSNLRDAAMDAQRSWLDAQLQRHHTQRDTLCILAFWHHPAYSSGGHGNNAFMLPIWQALARAGADLVLSGHDHDYERLSPIDEQGDIAPRTGVRSFVVGTGGARLTPMLFPKSASEVRDNSQFGVLRLLLRAHDYRWQFLSVEQPGLNDQGEARCHAAPD